MPFNDEGLARTIAACPVPIVTGIGHEPDTSIADMVADVRASTPTAAAETVAASKDDLKSQIEGFGASLNNSFSNLIAGSRMRLNVIGASAVFKNPMVVLGEQARSIDYYKERLQNALPKSIADRRQKTSLLRLALIKDAPHIFLKRKTDFGGVTTRFENCSKTSTDKYKNAINLQAARLEDLSPLKILGRGYSVSYNHDGEIIKSVNSVNEKDEIKILLSDGLIDCTVNDINRQEIAIDFLEA
jgi:exodeoxyribonuclease VII large subunit